MIQTASSDEIPSCDILLVTVTKVEITAVFDAAGKSPDECPKHFGSNKTYFDIGEHGGAKVFVVRSEMGTSTVGGSLTTVKEAISECRPSYAIMVGIAFGKCSKKQKIGDVLVSKQIQGYELQRVGTDEDGNESIILREDKVPASGKLLDRMRALELTWEDAKIRFGLIISGAKLVDNIDFLDELKSLAPELIGGEMEACGVHVACEGTGVGWVIVKSICDWADGKKARGKSKKQNLAAKNAAEFVMQTICAGGLAIPRTNQQTETAPDKSNSSQIVPHLSQDSIAVAQKSASLNVAVEVLIEQAARNLDTNGQVAKYLIQRINDSIEEDFAIALADAIRLERHLKDVGVIIDADTKLRSLVVLAEVERYMLESPKFDSDDAKLKSLLNEIETYA